MDTLSQTRGDTVSYTFQRKTASGDVIFTTPESIYFTLKENFNSSKIIVQKDKSKMRMDSMGVWRFTLEHSDTEELPYGVYVWDIQITEHGAVTTIAKGKLKLTQEATWRA